MINLIQKTIYMKDYFNFANRLKITFIVFLIACMQLIWMHFNGGIPTHYLMHSDEMPGISNWWNLLILPVLSWIVFYRISIRKKESNSLVENHSFRKISSRFIIAFVFGLVLTLLFKLEIELLEYMMLSLFFIAFIAPIFLSEYLFGFVMGTFWTFGAAIPTEFGVVLTAIYFLIYKTTKITSAYFKANFS